MILRTFDFGWHPGATLPINEMVLMVCTVRLQTSGRSAWILCVGQGGVVAAAATVSDGSILIVTFDVCNYAGSNSCRLRIFDNHV